MTGQEKGDLIYRWLFNRGDHIDRFYCTFNILNNVLLFFRLYIEFGIEMPPPPPPPPPPGPAPAAPSAKYAPPAGHWNEIHKFKGKNPMALLKHNPIRNDRSTLETTGNYTITDFCRSEYEFLLNCKIILAEG
jgi:hypothetical protein